MPTEESETSLSLTWAGDLDRDGRLDFVIHTSSDDSFNDCVWLSGKAAAGQLVGRAGCVQGGV